MTRFIKRHMSSFQQRTITFTAISFGLNAALGLAKLAMGLYLFSPWFVINAVYALVLCFARGLAVGQHIAAARAESPAAGLAIERRAYRLVGLLLCLLGVCYVFVCLRMFFLGDSTAYSGLTVYFVATSSFSKLGLAIYGNRVANRLNQPIIAALKKINLADALVSIVVTQCTLLAMGGAAQSAARHSAIAGLIVSALFLAQGVFMAAKQPALTALPLSRQSQEQPPVAV